MKFIGSVIGRIIDKARKAEVIKLKSELIKLAKENLELKKRVHKLTEAFAPIAKARREMLYSSDESLLFTEETGPEGKTEELAMLLTKLSPGATIFTPIAYQQIECRSVIITGEDPQIVSLRINQEQAETKLADFVDRSQEALGEARRFLYESELRQKKEEEKRKRRQEVRDYVYRNSISKWEMQRIAMATEKSPKDYLAFFIYSARHYGCAASGTWCGFCYKAFKKADSEYPLGEILEALGIYNTTHSYIRHLAMTYYHYYSKSLEKIVEHVIKRETPARVLQVLANCKRKVLKSDLEDSEKRKKIKIYEKMANKVRMLEC